jgi:hypothetical protein
MFEFRRRGGFGPGFLLVLAALSPFGGGIEAQSAGDSALAAAREELDRLIPRLDRLRDRATYAESQERMRKLREEQLPVDTFLVGPFRVVSLSEQRELATELMGDAWAEFQPLVDGSEDLVRPRTFLIHYYWSRDGMVFYGDSLLQRVELSRRYPVGSLRRATLEAVGNTLMKGMPPALREWSGGQPRVPLQHLPGVARELITKPSTATRRCFQGELAGCAEALGLRGTEGGWERWYTAEERRFYIRRSTRPVGDRETALWEGCVDGGIDDACDLLLRDREPLIPFTTEARASFLGHALWTGGAGAFQRLREADGEPLEDRLVAAAGIPRDSLLASWRREVLAARPSVWGGLGRSPLALLFWVAIFGALAMRSTRWRLG